MFLKASTKKDLFIHLGIIVSLGLVLLFLFFFVYLPITTNHGERIAVPDLKDKTIEQIETLLDENSLRYQINDSSYVEGAVPYTVITQHPIAGSEVKANRKIYITITAKNPPLVQMPNLVDKSLKTAEMDLKSRDLVLEKTNAVPSPYANLVIKQYANGTEVKAGDYIPKGTKITLDVGNGTLTSEIDLTDFVGMPIDDAKALLTEQGLKVGLEKKEPGDGEDQHTVIKQNPVYRKGAKIQMGEVIDLWYAE